MGATCPQGCTCDSKLNCIGCKDGFIFNNNLCYSPSGSYCNGSSPTPSYINCPAANTIVFTTNMPKFDFLTGINLDYNTYCNTPTTSTHLPCILYNGYGMLSQNKCASIGGTCYLTGSANVIYYGDGSSTYFGIKPLSTSTTDKQIKCDKSTFGLTTDLVGNNNCYAFSIANTPSCDSTRKLTQDATTGTWSCILK